MLIIPLSAVPSQSFNVVLSHQNCAITLLWRNDELYCDLSVNETAIWQGRVCRDRVALKPGPYAGLVGDLVFVDAIGTNDPQWAELNTRYFLFYLKGGEAVEDAEDYV